MQFLYPAFLFAFAALAIPIILHLFYFRRFKKVYFTNVRFLREVKEETSARSKLRNLLVLAMRLLALTFLVLAFAQPFIPARDAEVKKGRKSVSIYIDNSFSMSALSQDVALIDKARQRAREIVAAYSVEDEFQILSADFEGRHQRLVSQEDALSLIDEVNISPSVKRLSTVLTRQKQALNTGSNDILVAYIISDFQKNITDLETYQDTSVEVNLVPLQAVRERNISIDSAWFDAPVQMVNQTNPLIVRVKNNGDEDAENILLSIRDGGQTKPVGTLAVPARSSLTDTVNITILRTGWYESELKIPDFPVQFDDKYYFTYKVADEIGVLSINELAPNAFLDAAINSIENFSVTNQLSTNLDYARFPSYQMIVLNDLESVSSGLAFELNQYVANGGNLLVFPGREADLASYKSFLGAFPANELLAFEDEQRIVGTVNTEEFIFSDVFENRSANLKLPVTQGNFRLSDFGSRMEERLLTYRDGNPFLSKYQVGQGNLYLCVAPLDAAYGDLVRNGEIFIPMLYKMAISSRKASKIAYTIGRDEVIEAEHAGNPTEIVYRLKGEGEEFIPEQRIVAGKVLLSVGNQIPEAGFYDLFLNSNEILARYGFNYDRQESQLDYFSPRELQLLPNPAVRVIDLLDTAMLTAQIEERSQGITLWRFCLIMALTFLAAEVAILRLWKI